MLLQGVDYTRVPGGTVAAEQSQPFGAAAVVEPAAAPGDVAFVANVPTSGAVGPVASRYAQGWADVDQMARRQRLVIGVNTFQSLGETLGAAQARLHERVNGDVPAGTIGTAVMFVWRPAWEQAWPAAPLALGDDERAAERGQALNRDALPYGLFRSTILSSPPTAQYASAFSGAGYTPYVHVGDPDSPSFKVPAGRQRPGGGKAFLPGSFAEESDERLFDRLIQLIGRRTQMRPGHAAKPFPTVVAGGYQLRPSSAPGAEVRLSAIASQIDMQVRRVLYSQGTSPTAAYLPEPNLLVNWADVPRQGPAPADRAATDIFGGGAGESRALMTNLIAALSERGFPPAAIKERVAFKQAAAVATGATGQGERFRARTEQPALLPAEARQPNVLNLAEAYASVLRSGQSHANPSTWPTKARAAAGLDQGSANARQRAFRRARFHLKHPVGVGTATSLAVIGELAGADEEAAALPAAADTMLRDLARETVATIASYEEMLTEIIG